MCAGCEKAAGKALVAAEKEKAAVEKVIVAAEKEKAAVEKKMEKERVRALWEEALGKEEEAVKVLAWKAERALFHGLPKPVVAGCAYNKWRRWHDPNLGPGYVGDKYAVEAAEGGEAE